VRRACWVLLVLATGCPGDLHLGDKCAIGDAGDSPGRCDVRDSFCGEQSLGSGSYVCIARPAKPYIRPDRMQLDFVSKTSDIDPNQSLVQTIELTNEGLASLSITAVGLSGPNAGMFAPTTSFKNLPHPVAPRGTAYVQVTYKPQGNADRSAQLDITSDAVNAPTLAIPIVALTAQPDAGN
jgi:hypothetical protein